MKIASYISSGYIIGIGTWGYGAKAPPVLSVTLFLHMNTLLLLQIALQFWTVSFMCIAIASLLYDYYIHDKWIKMYVDYIWESLINIWFYMTVCGYSISYGS